MEPLSLRDTRNLNKGIQKLYTLHTLDTFGVDALSIVNSLVPGDVPEFHITSLRTRQVSSIFLPDFPGFTPEMQRVMKQHFGEHPIARQMPQTLDGVYKISDFISRQELHGLEGLYQQFLRLIDTEDQMIFFLPNANHLSSMRHSLIIKPSLRLCLSNKYQFLKWEIYYLIVNKLRLSTIK